MGYLYAIIGSVSEVHFCIYGLVCGLWLPGWKLFVCYSTPVYARTGDFTVAGKTTVGDLCSSCNKTKPTSQFSSFSESTTAAVCTRIFVFMLLKAVCYWIHILISLIFLWKLNRLTKSRFCVPPISVPVDWVSWNLLLTLYLWRRTSHVSFNRLQLVITTWQSRELLRWEWH
jgi:hypothetical protein